MLEKEDVLQEWDSQLGHKIQRPCSKKCKKKGSAYHISGQGGLNTHVSPFFYFFYFLALNRKMLTAFGTEGSVSKGVCVFLS